MFVCEQMLLKLFIFHEPFESVFRVEFIDLLVNLQNIEFLPLIDSWYKSSSINDRGWFCVCRFRSWWQPYSCRTLWIGHVSVLFYLRTFRSIWHLTKPLCLFHLVFKISIHIREFVVIREYILQQAHFWRGRPIIIQSVSVNLVRKWSATTLCGIASLIVAVFV